MTLSLPFSNKAAVLFGAALYTSLTFGALATPTPAEAKSADYYRAELQQPLEREHKGALSGTYWNCEGVTCAGVKGSSSAMRVCERLVKRHGPVDSFSVKGKALDEAKLAKCNAAAE